MQNWRGKCRIRGVNGSPNKVRIYETDGAVQDDEMSEAEYSRACLTPPLDELPFCPSPARHD